MQLKWLEDFLHLAETRSFTRSSEERHVTHPAFGRRIRSLELWVGVPLLDRSTYPVSLTPEGVEFLEVAKETVHLMQSSRDQMQKGVGVGQRNLVVASGRTLARTILPDWLMRLHQCLKPFQVRVVTGSVYDMGALLEQGTADFLFCYWHSQLVMQFDPNIYESHSIGHEQLVAVSVPTVGNQPKFSLHDNGREPIPYLAYAKGLVLGRVVDGYLAHAGSTYRLSQIHEADFAESLHELARAGLGVAWLPQSLVEGDLKSGVLVRADASGRELGLEVRIYHRRTSAKALVREIFEAM